MLIIDPDLPTPPFEQLKRQIVSRIGAGDWSPGDRLPPVRKLAAELGLAANTVARSYRELEAEGFLVTLGRNGTVVASTLDEPEVHERALALTREYAAAMAAIGIDADGLADYLRRVR